MYCKVLVPVLQKEVTLVETKDSVVHNFVYPLSAALSGSKQKEVMMYTTVVVQCLCEVKLFNNLNKVRVKKILRVY